MAVVVNNKFPIDTIARKAVGIDIPFSDPAVFRSNYLTRDAIKNNLTNFFSTKRGERVFNPFFGSAIYNAVFENMDVDTTQLVRKIVQDELNQYFPFVGLEGLNVSFNEDFNSISITITYVATNFGIQDEINIEL